MRAIFLDKAGALVNHMPYIISLHRLQPMPGALQGARALYNAGYQLFVVCNQPGVAHGYFPEHRLTDVETRIRHLLAEVDVPLAGFYYCPHHPDGCVRGYVMQCACRKPQPGLLCRVAHEYGLNLSQSWVIGENLDDIEAGRRAGCHTLLLGNSDMLKRELSPWRIPHYLTYDLLAAAQWIIEDTYTESNPFPIRGKTLLHEH